MNRSQTAQVPMTSKLAKKGKTKSVCETNTADKRTDTESHYAHTLREILKWLTTIDDSIKMFDDRMKGVELKTDVDEIKAVIPALKESVERNEIQQANKRIKIEGVQFHPDENRARIVLKLVELIGSPSNKDNIDMTYRNKTKKNTIVKFLQTHIRDSILKMFKDKTRESKNTLQNIGYQTVTTGTIYVNEYLLFDTRNLFYKTKHHIKDNYYKYVCTVNQKVYIRKADDKPAIRIKWEAILKISSNLHYRNNFSMYNIEWK